MREKGGWLMQNFKPAKLLVFILQDITMTGLGCEGETGLALRPHADMIPQKQRRKCVQLKQSSCKVETEYHPQSHSRRNGILQSALLSYPTAESMVSVPSGNYIMATRDHLLMAATTETLWNKWSHENTGSFSKHNSNHPVCLTFPQLQVIARIKTDGIGGLKEAGEAT